MPDTVSVRVADGDVWVDGEHLTRGDEVDIPADVYDRIPGSFERVDSDESTGDVDDETDASETNASEADGEADGEAAGEVTVDDLNPHPDDLTVDELEERIADVDDAALLETILEAEEASDTRTTAVDAIEERIADLEG